MNGSGWCSIVPAVLLGCTFAETISAPARCLAQETGKVTVKEMLNLKGPLERPDRLALSPDGKSLYSGSPQGITAWDLGEARAVFQLRGHVGEINGLVVAPDGKCLFSAGVDKTVKRWDLKTQKVIQTFRGHTQGVLTIALSKDGKRLFSAAPDGIRVWDVETGKQINLLRKHSVLSLVLSEDAKRLASGGTGGLNCLIWIWDADSGKEVSILKGHQKAITGLAFFKDGKRLVSGSEDGTLKIWDVETGKEVATLEGDGRPIAALACSKDGRRLFSCHQERLSVWDVEAGKLAYVIDHEMVVESLTMSGDARRLFCGYNNWTIKGFQVD